MGILHALFPTITVISSSRSPCTVTTMPLPLLPLLISPKPLPRKRPSVFPSIATPLHLYSAGWSQAESEEEGDSENTLVQPLMVPVQWLHPPRAIQESEWLRVTLHKWLDDEYCPEPTNIEISKVAARSYYESLISNHADLGEILLKMARDLESISYKESFHGAFSSANAAASLIAQRIASIAEK